jgi:hypothetical protein
MTGEVHSMPPEEDQGESTETDHGAQVADQVAEEADQGAEEADKGAEDAGGATSMGQDDEDEGFVEPEVEDEEVDEEDITVVQTTKKKKIGKIALQAVNEMDWMQWKGWDGMIDNEDSDSFAPTHNTPMEILRE